MRILHTSDWHLGRTLHGVDLTGAHARFLDALVEMARTHAVDAVLVAGDVYDRAFPNLEAVALLEDALVRLCEVTRVIVTPGNHDSAQRLGFGADLFRDRLLVRSRPLDAASPIVVPDTDGHDGLLVYAVPYLDPDAARGILAPWGPEAVEGATPPPLARSHEAVLTAVAGRAASDLAKRRVSARTPAVLMAHAFVHGGKATDSERDIRVGGVDSVPRAVFEAMGVDYLALGHLHGPQRIGAAEGPGLWARYSGSPLALSFSEKDQTKSVALVELDATGVRSVELLPTPQERPLSEVRGSLKEVLGRRYADARQHWVRVIVDEDARPADLVTTVKKAFPHALEVHFQSHGGDLPLPGLTRDLADPLGVLDEFVTAVGGAPASDAEKRVLREAYEVARRAEAGA